MKAELQIVNIHKDKLKKYPFNPRKLRDPDGIKKLRILIKEHGFRNPLEIWLNKSGNYEILAGNHRFEAAILEGVKVFPCTVFNGTRSQAAARVISDNKSNDWTEYDFPVLKDMLTELDDGSIELAITGFDEDELKGLIDWEGEGEWDESIGGLPDGDKEPYSQITFTVHESQAETINTAMGQSIKNDDFEGQDNKNKNGNALFFICRKYLSNG